jgi:methylated-DNA-[protein]-cysteine S-methyltransferase
VTLSRARLESPVGRLDLIANDDALVAVLWERDDPNRVRLEPRIDAVDHPILSLTAQQLGEYFAGERRVFDIPLQFRGPEFQKSVWQALLTIPFGETRTYGQIAQQIGRPTASRAVGAANGANPISIIAPCHRVIGADGALTGFAGGMENKRLLLNLEGARHGRQDDLFA